MNDVRDMVQEKVRADIARVGWSAIGVFNAVGQDPIVPFMYTVGLTDRAHPELIVCGHMQPEVAHGLLAQSIKVLETLDPEGLPQRTNVPGILENEAYEPIFVPVTLRVEPYLLTAADNYLGAPAPALQLVLPDAEHNFPWEPNYNTVRQPQPLLGEFPS